MAEEKKTETDAPKDGGGISMGEIRKLITDTVASVVGTPKEASKTDDGKGSSSTSSAGGSAGGVAAEVQRQVQKIRDREAREKRDADVDAALKEVKEKVAEKPPVERRRVHKFMGWGE